MKSHATAPARRTAFERSTSPMMPPLLGALLLTLAAGCGPLEEQREPLPHLGSSVQRLEEDNGLTVNGLAFNGLAMNGLAMNGLAMNGLASSEFASWFQQNPSVSNHFMKYLVRCAVPAGEARTYSDGVTTYTWAGDLGLAPDWSSGAPATVAEQQVISGCLATMINKFGRSVAISVLGTNAQGQPIPYTDPELADFSQREACFFGNLFNDTGLFVGNDQPLLLPSKSSLRACALASTNSSTSSECPPLVHVGECQTRCTRDPTGTYYTQCTYNGVTYLPLTSRIRTADIVLCGDGLCQPSELCGTGNSANNCGVDCGTCAGFGNRSGQK